MSNSSPIPCRWRFRLVLILLLSTAQHYLLPAQIKRFVLSESKPVRSIDPRDTSFADLSCIGKAIGDARVVMLGEQEHGDATTLEAKTKIVRYLCEEKGFDVLLFESDFWGLNDGWSKVLRQPDSLQKFVKTNVYPVWTNCHGCQYLFETWIPEYTNQNTSFDIGGSDPHPVLWWSKEHLYVELEVLVNTYFPNNRYLVSHIGLLSDLTENMISPVDSNLIRSQVSYTDSLKTLLTTHLGKDSFWVQTLHSIKVVLLNRLNPPRSIKSFNLRDEMMAQNLSWLLKNRYQNRKVIVWPANTHIIKLSGHFNADNANQYQYMGSYFAKQNQLMDSNYVLGFTSAKGEAGMIGNLPYTFKSGYKSSFERWLLKTGYEYAFVDFKGLHKLIGKKDIRFRMAGGGGRFHHYSHKAPWYHLYDGVFYIRDMERCRPIKVGGKVLLKN